MKDKLRQLLALILALSICFSLLSANVWATDEPEDVPTENTEVVTEKDKSEDKQEETPAETQNEEKQEEAPAETQSENKQEEAPAETQIENKQEETPAEAQSEKKQEEAPAETQIENKQEETPAETQIENKQEETPAEAQSEKKQEEEAPAQNEAETQPMKKKAMGKMPGMGLTVNAAQTQTEELLTTITATAKEQASYSTEGVATVSFSYTTNGSSAYMNNGTTNWGWWGYGWTATVTPADGYTITKCIFYDDQNRTATDSEAPFVVETTEEDKTPKVNGTPILANQSKGITKIEVYGYATPATVDPVPYMAWNGSTLEEKDGDNACKTYTVVTVDTTTFGDGKWYVVSNSVTVSSRITVTGTVNLILCDGATLTASKGITVNSSNTLNIYAQSAGTGELNAGSDINVASIGGGARYKSGGTVNIHGGKITATGGSSASGIGGALEGGNGEVNIYSGEVTAQGKNYAAGIGGYSGKSGGTVNIYGGIVNASGSEYGTTGIGIGGTNPGNCVVHIYGGEVTATSEKAAAGIQGTITIDGGKVTAKGGGESYTIDCYSGETYSSNGISGTVTINGGTVSATGGNVTGEITNFGGNIYACNGIGGTVTINGGTVTATGGSHTGIFENHRGTTVKEKGFGGSLTLGTGMYLYGGTSANPESNLSNYRAGAGDYTGDRYVYMTVNNVVPHIHSFTYTADGATVTAACTAGCDITEGLALTISAPTELTYDGSAKAATLSTGYNTTAFPGEYMIKYYKGANEVEAANVKAAGDYTAKVTVGEATASVDFTIAKATPSIETIPTASAITYGQKLADSTLTGGTGSVAGGFAWKDSTVAPAVSDSQNTEYDVVFTPTDENYDAAECKVKLTVNKADSAVTTAPTAKTLTYNGSAQSLINAGTASGGTMKYAVTTANQEPAAEAYTFDNTSLPTSTNAGTYYVWYKVVGDSNHNDTTPASVTATIAKAAPTANVPTGLTATYGQTLADVTLTNPSGNTAGNWAWVDDTISVGDAGQNTFKATFTPSDTDNYNTVERVDVSVQVNRADITPTVSISNWTYGRTASEPSVEGNSGNGTVTYTYAKQGETTFTDKVPTAAGSYTVKATVAETANYNSGTNTADFIINQASITITADDKSTKYGEEIAELTYTVSGDYKTGDDLGVTLNTEAAKTSPVNVYDITVNWNQNPNYSAVLTGGKYTITKDGATVSASAYSGTYDGKAHGITVEETKHNIFDLLKPEAKVYYSTEELTVENFKEKGSTENITYTNVGEYTVYYFVESGNYDVQPISGSKTVSITKAPLTVTAKDKTIAYGEAPANDGVKYVGFAEGEDESVLTGELSYAYNYEQGNTSGEYTITPSGLTSDNYEITFVNGKLTVKALGDPKLEVTTEGEDKRLDIVLDKESAEKLLTKDELKEYNNGVPTSVYVLMDERSDSEVPAADKKLAENFLKDGKIGQYLDLTLWVQVGDNDARQITNAASAVTLKIAIPDALQVHGSDVERTFYLIRVHDGKAASLASTTGNELEADSRLFSTYAIGYKDTEVKDDTKKDDTKKDTTTKTKTNTSKTDTTKKSSGRSPKTGDAAMLGVWFSLAGASATGLGALALGGKKRNRRIKRNYTGRRLNK